MKYTTSPARSHTDASRVVTALAALAQETRLAIFRLLVEHARDGLTPGAIALKLKLAASANGDWKFYTGGKAEFVARIVAFASAELLLGQAPVDADREEVIATWVEMVVRLVGG